jgi:peptidoglycan/xylan/chitin deacetylase (PgdA/CDA1 family)
MKRKKNWGLVTTFLIVAIVIGVVKLEEKNIALKNIDVVEVISDIKNEDENIIVEETEKIAYITIDDGPSKYTSQILDILDENKVKATFFMIDGNMKNYTDEVRRIVSDGHGAGFHSVSHEKEIVYSSAEATLTEFNTCQETMYEITGITSNLIRLPYGSKPYMSVESYDKLVENGYKIWDWNVDTLDWKSTTDQIVSNVLYYGRKHDELILLFHEREQTLDALSSSIKVLKSRGYTILPISENMIEKNFWKDNLK